MYTCHQIDQAFYQVVNRDENGKYTESMPISNQIVLPGSEPSSKCSQYKVNGMSTIIKCIQFTSKDVTTALQNSAFSVISFNHFSNN